MEGSQFEDTPGTVIELNNKNFNTALKKEGILFVV
jgi:hypothetical protein